jgi:hypothetical protein
MWMSRAGCAPWTRAITCARRAGCERVCQRCTPVAERDPLVAHSCTGAFYHRLRRFRYEQADYVSGCGGLPPRAGASLRERGAKGVRRPGLRQIAPDGASSGQLP